jgi:hypothetical protein
MPTRNLPNLTRPVAIRVMVTETEKRALLRAAKKGDMPLSGYVRGAALEKARRMEVGG